MGKDDTGVRRGRSRWLPSPDAEGGSTAVSTLFKRGWRHTELKFAGTVTQSRMLTFRPHHLLVPYTRTMMAALLLQPHVDCIGMIGLGGGSQVKFCRRYLPGVRLEVVENNPAVVAMRRRFRIPDDDACLQVFVEDGATFLGTRPGRYDLLLVDAYDPQGIPPALSTQRWYDDCRNALAPDGVLATNLFCADALRHVEKLQRSFGKHKVLVLQEPTMSNRVAFAWTGDAVPRDADAARAALERLPTRLRKALAPEFAALAQARRSVR
ncbi:transferase [Luteimonas aestuarii]|uniref:Transferase n=1 Tax=Luteimonas aestuarii TaxID=453837 RepID=A0A4V3AMW7_9GAMM|nr:transferase [Luteimonas aestuarii]TDK28365.1 transferase [Luteimonas aestuarii]